ncbi:MAG: alpha/beta hydrolase, partial [Chloroflexi bacterium]|nr:alpha/beta hydrolase [Chloroflexota bacterium]
MPVAAALTNPVPPRLGRFAAAGYTFAFRSWGDASAQPLLLVHGVTSSSATWWRIGPALAASGRHVVAPDLPGHGRTGGWRGRHRFFETADDLLAFVRTAGLGTPDLEVIGHSWGGMVCAALPAAGLRPARLVLLDPPRWTLADIQAYVL